MRAGALALAVLLSSPPLLAADETPMTSQQGEAILKELQAIRQLLERQAAPPPAAPKAPAEVTISLGERSFLGDAGAPLLMVEFTDYQCPYCRRFHEQTFPQIQRDWIDTGKLRFVSMDLPLSFHANAETAANAARCAGDQGKFWELRETMIRNAAKLAPEDIQGYARDLGLDMGSFEQCLAARPYQKSISDDVSTAQAAGITGTPSFVIGANPTGREFKGIRLVGAQPYPAFKQQLERLLPADPPAAGLEAKPDPAMESGRFKLQGQVGSDAGR